MKIEKRKNVKIRTPLLLNQITNLGKLFEKIKKKKSVWPLREMTSPVTVTLDPTRSIFSIMEEDHVKSVLSGKISFSRLLMAKALFWDLKGIHLLKRSLQVSYDVFANYTPLFYWKCNYFWTAGPILLIFFSDRKAYFSP